jgi:hypothetical protein
VLTALLVDARLGRTERYFIGKEGQVLVRVPDEITDCALFVGVAEEQRFFAKGTAFAFGMTASPPFRYNKSYFVTAKHVVVKTAKLSMDGKVTIRINKRGSGTVALSTSPQEWFFHPTDDTVDVAVLPLPSIAPFHLRHIPDSIAATSEIMEREGIGIGDEVFITGLFVNHVGIERNIPILRTGNIAMMAKEPLVDGEEAILIEARSIGGLSGSPVFVNISGVRRGEVHAGVENCVYWLGIVTGHWEGGMEADVVTQDYKVNRGIGIVVPATRVMEVLTQDALVAERHEWEKKKNELNKPVND